MAQQGSQTGHSTDRVEHVAFRSATAFTQALRGAPFPATKQTLIETARKNSTPPETLNILEQMPEGTYEQMADVTHNLPRALSRADQAQVA